MYRVLFFTLLLFISGCASNMVKHPAADKINKVAIISIYSNLNIYDINKKDKSESIITLAKMASGEGKINKGNIALTSKALGHYSSALNNSKWKVMPNSELLTHPAYLAFIKETKGDGVMGFLKKASSASWAVPTGMVYIPYDVITNKSTKRRLGDDSHEKAKSRLAQLSKDLDVDGVAVIHMDLAYKTPMMSIAISGILTNKRNKAKPRVSSEIVIVNSDGKIALETPAVKRGKGKRYESKDNAPMLLGNYVDLSGKDGEQAIEAFSEAIKKHAKSVKSEIKKGL